MSKTIEYYKEIVKTTIENTTDLYDIFDIENSDIKYGINVWIKEMEFDGGYILTDIDHRLDEFLNYDQIENKWLKEFERDVWFEVMYKEDFRDYLACRLYDKYKGEDYE